MAGDNDTPIEREEVLTAHWLTRREHYDSLARNTTLLNAAELYLSQLSNPVIVDLGAGTGNQTLYLLKHLTRPAHLILVEQHATLLTAARDTIATRYAYSANSPDSLTVNTPHCSHTITFAHTNLLNFLENQCRSKNSGARSVDLLTASALLDLLTIDELQQLVNGLTHSGAALYATLNYIGFHMTPEHPQDKNVVTSFERHMTRMLDRGKPLGPGAPVHLQSMLQGITNAHCQLESSHWVIHADDPVFLRANMAFYQQALANDSRYASWIKERLQQIDAGLLELTVMHQDIWLPPTH